MLASFRPWVVIVCLFPAALSAANMPSAPQLPYRIEVGRGNYPDLETALAAIPALRHEQAAGRPIEVRLPSGTTRLRREILIGAALSGTEDAPLILRGAADGRTRLVGSAIVQGRPARDGDVPGGRLSSGLIAIDLAGMSGPATFVPRGAYVPGRSATFALFQGGKRLMPSRWPARGYASAVVSREGSNDADVHLSPEQVAQWRNEPAPWAGGYWHAEWAFELAAAKVDAARGLLSIAKLHAPPRKEARYFVQNLLSALTQPGSFFVAPDRHLALVMPRKEGGQIELALTDTLLRIEKAQHVEVHDIAFDRSLGTAVQIRDSQSILLRNCAVRQTGASGIVVAGGKNVAIERSVVAETAETGVVFSGGDRRTLTSARHRFVDGIISRFGEENPTYRPAILLQGVGNEVRGSLLTQGDHNAVMLSGNLHDVIGNEISHVLRDTEDAGAVYLGRNWTERGMQITGNYFHDLGSARQTMFLTAIYLDDQASGTHMADNVILGTDFGIVIGGGRDNSALHNLIVNPRRGGIFFDARGMKEHHQGLGSMAKALTQVPTGSAAWKTAFPTLAALQEKDYGVPDGNSVMDNRISGPVAIFATPDLISRFLPHASNVHEQSAGRANMAAARRLATSARPGWTIADRRKALSALLPRLTVPDD